LHEDVLATDARELAESRKDAARHGRGSISKEEASTLLGLLVGASQRLTRPYVVPMLNVLLPSVEDEGHERVELHEDVLATDARELAESRKDAARHGPRSG
jgi:hypothetical protein